MRGYVCACGNVLYMYPRMKKKPRRRSESKAKKQRQQKQQQQQASTSKTPKYQPPKAGTTGDLSVGSLIEVCNDVSDEPLYGVVRWMGAEAATHYILVGVELDEEHDRLPLTLTDGTYNGDRYFQCAPGRGLFVPLKQCRQDGRFQDGVPTPIHQIAEPNFQSVCNKTKINGMNVDIVFFF